MRFVSQFSKKGDPSPRGCRKAWLFEKRRVLAQKLIAFRTQSA
jgi:hypothetical protein